MKDLHKRALNKKQSSQPTNQPTYQKKNNFPALGSAFALGATIDLAADFSGDVGAFDAIVVTNSAQRGGAKTAAREEPSSSPGEIAKCILYKSTGVELCSWYWKTQRFTLKRWFNTGSLWIRFPLSLHQRPWFGGLWSMPLGPKHPQRQRRAPRIIGSLVQNHDAKKKNLRWIYGCFQK